MWAETSTTSVTVAAGTLIGTIIAAWLAYMGQSHARQANDAVNHKHPTEDRLFDMVASTRTQVNDLVVRTIGIEAISTRLDNRIDRVVSDLTDHIVRAHAEDCT